MDDNWYLEMLYQTKKLHEDFKKSHFADSEKKTYKIYRNKLNKLIKVVERDYYQDKFLYSATNIKKTWQIIKTILNKGNDSVITKSFKSGNTIITDKNEIVNKYNGYFSNIGPSLAAKIPKPTSSHMDFPKGQFKESFSLFITCCDEIINIVINMI